MSYEKLPPFEFIKTHGILGLNPGSYKTGKVAEKPTDTDTVLKITRDKAEWYRNGKLHREDGPAFERSDGYRAWYRNGQLHREDVPAAERLGDVE